MPIVSDSVLKFAKEQFENVVENLLDDPSGLLHPYRELEPAQELLEYRKLATDLGLDFDVLVAKGS